MIQKQMHAIQLIHVHYTIQYIFYAFTEYTELTWDSGNLVVDVRQACYGRPWTASNTQLAT